MLSDVVAQLAALETRRAREFTADELARDAAAHHVRAARLHVEIALNHFTIYGVLQ